MKTLAPWDSGASPTFSRPKPAPPARVIPRPAEMAAPERPELPRMAGCTERCQPARVAAANARYLVWELLHDPATHERFGAQQAQVRAGVIRAGPLLIDLDTASVTHERHGQCELTATEWRLVAYLASQLGRLCPHDDILTAVWGANYCGSPNLLRVNVDRIRAAFGCAAALLETRRHLGYLLRADGESCTGACDGWRPVKTVRPSQTAVLACLEAASGWLPTREIARISGLSWGGVNGAVVALRERGYVVEAKPPYQGGGYRLIRETAS